MRLRVALIVPMGLIFGVTAFQAGRSWLDREVNSRVQARQALIAPHAEIKLGTLVAATQPLRFGAELTRAALKEIPWPASEMPKGAFAHLDDLFSEKGKRVALAAIEVNEPVLASKVTAPGQRANLAALIDEGMKAITIRVDDVVGVAGFVLPGDMVDVLLTRQSSVKEDAVADVILQNLRVLGVDQITDPQTAKTAVARAVTLEVATNQAQRLVVAQTVGRMTLVLRSVAETRHEATSRVSAAELTNAEATPGAVIKAPTSINVSVTRNLKRDQYFVPLATSEMMAGHDH